MRGIRRGGDGIVGGEWVRHRGDGREWGWGGRSRREHMGAQDGGAGGGQVRGAAEAREAAGAREDGAGGVCDEGRGGGARGGGRHGHQVRGAVSDECGRRRCERCSRGSHCAKGSSQVCIRPGPGLGCLGFAATCLNFLVEAI